MTDILDRIKGVLADSRIQELDWIIDTLFGSPLTSFPGDIYVEIPGDVYPYDPPPEEFDLEGERQATEIQRKTSCGFRTWHQSPIHTIVTICNYEIEVGDKITRLRAYRKILSESSSAARQASQYITHCIQSLSKNENPLKWDAWLYLDMHGDEGLQP